VRVQFHAHKPLEQVRHFDPEKADSAIRVHQESHAALRHTVTHRFHQLRQQEEVILEKGMRRHLPILRRNAQRHFDPSFRRRVRPHLANLLVDRRLGDFAFLDVHHQPVVRLDEANVQPLLELVPLASNHHAVPVPVRLRTRDDGRNQVTADSPDALEQIRNLLMLDLQLLRVTDMLVLATSACAEIRTERLDAVRRWPEHV
jgi:hypothetical protein